MNVALLKKVARDIRDNPKGFDYWDTDKCVMQRIRRQLKTRTMDSYDIALEICLSDKQRENLFFRMKIGMLKFEKGYSYLKNQVERGKYIYKFIMDFIKYYNK